MNKKQMCWGNFEILLVPINEIINQYLVGTISLREVTQPHVQWMKQYILSHLETSAIGIAPLIVHLDEKESDFSHGDEEFSIIDGSHRIKAMVQLHFVAMKAIDGEDEQERQKAYQLLKVFEESVLTVQLYQGMTIEEQHQYYLDIQRQKSSFKWTNYLLNKSEKQEMTGQKPLDNQSGETGSKGFG